MYLIGGIPGNNNKLLCIQLVIFRSVPFEAAAPAGKVHELFLVCEFLFDPLFFCLWGPFYNLLV